MGDETDGVDRISDLPLFIIHNIMSNLSVKEIARTSLLSKKWKYIRRSYPILDFDQVHFVGPIDETNPITGLRIYPDEFFYERIIERLMDFVKYVHLSVHRFCVFKFRMLKFRIAISLVDLEGLTNFLDGWLTLAVENGVQDLDVGVVTIREVDRDRRYTVPQVLFSAKTVTNLRLAGCKLELPCDSVELCFLKTLTLDNVHLDEQMINKLTSECTRLEELYFHSCSGMTSFCITEPCKLKTLHIHVSVAVDIKGVKISVPSLRVFNITFEPRLRSRCVVDLAGSRHLTDLKLVGDILEERDFHYLLSLFPLLKSLYVEDCRFLRSIVISSNQLEELKILKCANLRAIDIDAPNLQDFAYLLCPIIPTCSIKVPCPWILAFSYIGTEPNWYNNIKEFLSSAHSCELNIFVDSVRNAFHLEDFPHRSPTVLRQVEHYFTSIRMPSNLEDLLDGIFLLCYPKRLTIVTGKSGWKKMITFLLSKLKNEDVSCCETEDIKCWRHYLRGFVLERPMPMVLEGNEEAVDIDNLVQKLSTSPKETLEFHLDWCLPALDDSTVVEN